MLENRHSKQILYNASRVWCYLCLGSDQDLCSLTLNILILRTFKVKCTHVLEEVNGGFHHDLLI